MSDTDLLVKRVFSELGLSIVRYEGSDPSYESFVIEGCGPTFCIRVERDRESEVVELRAKTESNEWFDLLIVMTFLLGESKLVEDINLREQLAFVRINFDELAQLLDIKRYPNVKPQLRSLKLNRAKNHFPEWYM